MSNETAVKEPEEKTVTVTDAPAAPAAATPPSREELRAQGWSAEELDKGEKMGLVAKADEGKPPEKKRAADAKPPEGSPAAAAAGAAKPEPRANATLDYKFSPEEEKVVADTFGKGHPLRAFYFRAKNERHSRQAAEARIRELETQLKARVEPLAAPAVVRDAQGREIDPETQPLTLKALKELQAAEAESIRTRQAEQHERGAVLKEAQTSQEEYVRSANPDFDKAVELAKDLMTNLDALVPERAKQTKIVKMIRDLQVAAANADKLELDDHHAAVIAYEIGQMHPQWGKAPEEGEDTGGRKDPKAGGLSAEQMKRIEANTQRRGSSASVPSSGGKRTVSVEDVDLAVLDKMTYKERAAFREKHPDRYASLLRG